MRTPPLPNPSLTDNAVASSMSIQVSKLSHHKNKIKMFETNKSISFSSGIVAIITFQIHLSAG